MAFVGLCKVFRTRLNMQCNPPPASFDGSKTAFAIRDIRCCDVEGVRQAIRINTDMALDT
jgi:hypothetical protein